MDVFNVGDRILCQDKYDMQSWKTELEEQGYGVQIELRITDINMNPDCWENITKIKNEIEQKQKNINNNDEKDVDYINNIEEKLVDSLMTLEHLKGKFNEKNTIYK